MPSDWRCPDCGEGFVDGLDAWRGHELFVPQCDALNGCAKVQPPRDRWSDYFRRSRSARYEFTARKKEVHSVRAALDRVADALGGGGPGYGDAATYLWELPTGTARYSAGGFFEQGLWISNTASVLLLCHVIDLVPPRFASDNQRDEASFAFWWLRDRLDVARDDARPVREQSPPSDPRAIEDLMRSLGAEIVVPRANEVIEV